VVFFVKLSIPKLALVVLIGPSGSGKSTFARKHFRATEILSSDFCRGMLCDDENNQSITNEAFSLLHHIAAQRLALGKLTVIDATSVQFEARKPLVELARRFHCFPVAIVLNLPEAVCQERNAVRPDRNFGPHVIRNQRSQLRRSLRGLTREGFRDLYVLESPEEVDSVVIERVPLWNDLTQLTGPFDVIGDLHGCADELELLLEKLGYRPDPLSESDEIWTTRNYAHPEGRKAIFVGDLVDRGPRIVDCLRLVRNMVRSGSALCVPGNHDVKLLKKLDGRDVKISHGLAETLTEIDSIPESIREAFRVSLKEFLTGLVSHYVLDGGKLVVAHAGMKAEMQGRGSGRVRDFALYGETTGEIDEFGLPIRLNWAADYRGAAMVVYGHTPTPEAEWLNRTINIDTGCVFGGKLTALRYPELELVSVPAGRVFCEPIRPLVEPNRPLTAQQGEDEMLDLGDVTGKRIISTQHRGNVMIREGHATAALEVMSRFAVNPKWLIYLPPTMSPCESSQAPGYLEHPAEAFAYYRNHGVAQVICEEKHMGSRAMVILCRDQETARTRFGILEDESGIVVTRTGRRFFNEIALEEAFLTRLRTAVTAADLWSKLNTNWLALDGELLPWSAKAQELLKTQYAAVGAAGRVAMSESLTNLERTALRLSDTERANGEVVLESLRQRRDAHRRFVEAYRRYCWPVNSLHDLKLAPFHLLASEGKVHADQVHRWHLDILAEVSRADPGFVMATRSLEVDVTDSASVASGLNWWLKLTEEGGEGMVVKPREFLYRGSRGLVQPAVKCRGREYLRIIYGPDYDTEENLTRLRPRRLGSKRSLALSEFALGIEAMERFVRKEPLRRVHECVFGVLALESEAVDPRL
jgi:protein phosphatase